MRLLSLVALGLMFGCSNDPIVIDGSSPENFARTAEQARRDIPDAERLRYDAALKSPPGTRYGDTPAERDALARQVYDGMTAREVVDGQ